ncbi:hypothetical protein J4E85_005934 [Alternaria conjuncta]|uniref:uncharacterized protein n=1 Tax=Alternaria conjuncta TaxID=181017 RepID=UPI00222000F5|nr:uncharacterized protein J4E85_005934 [Alternaria conjuncta]KAI4927423.1 hypothetical protein J4E85_005934 [Alternaria conjuncta]
MESLAELSVTHRKDVDTSGLRATFQRHQITLSSIVRLRILSRGSWSFLVEACPNVEILALEYNLDQDNIMHAAGALKHLTDFEICRDTWRKKDIKRLLQFLPEIQSLALRGTLGQEKLSVSTTARGAVSLRALSILTRTQTFAEVFGLFPELTKIAITAIQEVTDEDLEGEYSDDGSGYGSIYGEMMWEHELDEDQSSVAMKFFEHCPVLETLCLVRTGCVRSWYPTRGSKGSLESVYSPRDGYKSWHQSDELEIREHDKEGFPKLFKFPRPTNFCSEAWDHQSNWSESSESMEYWVSEVLLYSRKKSNID